MTTDHQSSKIKPNDYEITKRDANKQEAYRKIREHAKAAAASAPPITGQQLEFIRRIFRNPTPDHQLMRWRVKLACGHIVEAIRNVCYVRPTDGGASSAHCPTCDEEVVIVAYEPIGPKGELPEARPKPDALMERTARQRQIERLRAELARLESEAVLEDIPAQVNEVLGLDEVLGLSGT